jgi:hypothetical protein
MVNNKPLGTNKHLLLKLNQEASAKNKAIGEGRIQKYDVITRSTMRMKI